MSIYRSKAGKVQGSLGAVIIWSYEVPRVAAAAEVSSPPEKRVQPPFTQIEQDNLSTKA